jgi:hypothetical protein
MTFRLVHCLLGFSPGTSDKLKLIDKSPEGMFIAGIEKERVIAYVPLTLFAFVAGRLS